jgi:proline iminopeptidase
MEWHAHHLTTPDGRLAWFDTGNGPPVIFISGGPGDDHRYLRALASPLAAQFLCILFDQRGTGGSKVNNLTPGSVHVDRLCDDIDALRSELGAERISLVGHSWGATLALCYGTRLPERLNRLALLSPGPLLPELDEVYAANLQRMLSTEDREGFRELNVRRRTTRDAGDLDTYRDVHLKLMDDFIADRWIYDPEVAQRFRREYRAEYAFQPRVNRWVNESLDREDLWEQIAGITAPSLILYGYQDVEPITQAFLLLERLPQLEIRFLNKCGHIPWLDQPEETHRILSHFLST